MQGTLQINHAKQIYIRQHQKVNNLWTLLRLIDLQIVANLIINNSSQLASLTLFREEAHHSII